MSRPRQILPQSTLLLTRRCTQRQFLLRPEQRLNEAFRYCVAAAAQRTGIQLHGFVVLSNHWHSVVTDPEARVPEFLQLVHRNVALCVNALRRRTENVWSSAKPSIVRLETPADALRKLIYVLANPVASDLVARATDWPGATTAGMSLGETDVISRPKLFFSDSGDMPDEVEMSLSTLPGFESLDDQQLDELIARTLGEREDELAADRESLGIQIVGRQKCLLVSPSETPRTNERARRPGDEDPTKPMMPREFVRKHDRVRFAPTFAALERSVRVGAIERVATFLRRYREARSRWLAGALDVVFPAGTYWLRIHAGVICESTGPP